MHLGISTATTHSQWNPCICCLSYFLCFRVGLGLLYIGLSHWSQSLSWTISALWGTNKCESLYQVAEWHDWWSYASCQLALWHYEVFDWGVWIENWWHAAFEVLETQGNHPGPTGGCNTQLSSNGWHCVASRFLRWWSCYGIGQCTYASNFWIVHECSAL